MNEYKFTKEDIQFLLDRVNEGTRVLVADCELGIPTIHEQGYIPGYEAEVQHCGFGVFIAKTPTFEISFCGGGAMGRLAGNKGWTVLSVKGDYPYDFDAVKAKLTEILANWEVTPGVT